MHSKGGFYMDSTSTNCQIKRQKTEVINSLIGAASLVYAHLRSISIENILFQKTCFT